MSTSTIRAALLAALTSAMPTRTVSRDFIDFSQHKQADLQAGVVTLIGLGEGSFADVIGRETDLGTLSMLLIGQVKVAENAAPSAVEDAEDALAAEIKAACKTGLAGYYLQLKAIRQSGQIEHPYGWVACDIDVVT